MRLEWRFDVPMRDFAMLRVGGRAQAMAVCNTCDELAEAAAGAQSSSTPLFVLGAGSNIVPSDAGVPGAVLLNRAKDIAIGPSMRGSAEVVAETGCSFQELFLKTAQAGLRGLEYAVGIPGTLGGALVSNAGAYRSNVSEFLTALEVVDDGQRRWVEPAWMEFSYRDSVLRRDSGRNAVVLRVKMRLERGDRWEIYQEAREYQRQRISKQPPQSSVGSFFKNVEDPALASRLPNLPMRLRDAGVVPAGYLIQEAGLAGFAVGGAMFSHRHANFIVNVRRATASDVRRLAEAARDAVASRFGVRLVEEALYIGDWSGWIG